MSRDRVMATGFTGWVLLAPKEGTPSGKCELWANLGGVNVGLAPMSQAEISTVPPYLAVFSSACTQEQYLSLVAEIKAEMVRGVGHVEPGCCGCFGGHGPASYEEWQARQQVKASEVDQLIKEKTTAWAFAPRLEHVGGGQMKEVKADNAALNHLGEKCEYWFRNEENSDGHWAPCWPPRGFNLVITINAGDDFRQQWPASAGAALTMAPAAQQMSRAPQA